MLSLQLSAQKVAPNKSVYAEGVDFTVERFTTFKTGHYGNDTRRMYIAEKGHTFITAIIKFTNTTKKDVEIDFEKFLLIDSEGKKYNLNTVVQSMKVGSTGTDYVKKINAGKTKQFMLSFWPGFPKKQEMVKLEYDGQIVELSML